MTAGFCFFRKRSKLAALYKIRKTVRLLEDGSTEDCWLGTNSNVAAQARPMTITNNATMNVLVVVNKNDLESMLSNLPESISQSFPKGTVDIDKTNPLIKHFFEKADGTLTDNEVKVLIRLSVCCPLPFGRVLRTGELNQEAYTQLGLIEPDFFAFWAEMINTHDEALQSIFLTETSLTQYLPPSAPTGHGYLDNPFITMNDIDQDDETCIEQANELRNECNVIAALNISKSPSDDASLAGKSVVVTGVVPPSPSSNETAAAAILSTMNMNTASAMNTLAPAPVATFTATEHSIARALAIGAIYDPVTRKVVLPLLSEFFGPICALSSKKDQRETVQHTLLSIEDHLAESNHYLCRHIDFPTMSNVGLGFLAQAQWLPDSIESLEMNTSNGFILNMIMPDTHAMAKAKAEAIDANVAEEALGEHHSKKSKMDTTFTSITELGGISTLLTSLGNALEVCRLFWRFDLNDPSTWPTPVKNIITLANMITSKKARKFLKKQTRTDKEKVIYYVMNQVLCMVSAFATASKDVTVTSAILCKKLDEMSVSNYATGDKIYETTKDKLDQVFMNSSDVPITPLWKNAPSKKKADEKERKAIVAMMQPAKDKSNKDKDKERREAAAERAKNRQKTDQNSAGNFLKTSVPNLQLPNTIWNKDFKPCKSNARDNEHCSFGSKCNFDHTHFNDWTKPRQKALVKVVDESEGKISFVGIDEKKLQELRADTGDS